MDLTQFKLIADAGATVVLMVVVLWLVRIWIPRIMEQFIVALKEQDAKFAAALREQREAAITTLHQERLDYLAAQKDQREAYLAAQKDQRDSYLAAQEQARGDFMVAAKAQHEQFWHQFEIERQAHEKETSELAKSIRGLADIIVFEGTRTHRDSGPGIVREQ